MLLRLLLSAAFAGVRAFGVVDTTNIISQCNKFEPGCSSFSDNWRDRIDPLATLTHPNRFTVTVRRYRAQAGYQGTDKVDPHERSCLGDEIGKETHAKKNDCRTWSELGGADTMLNYVLPDSKVMNHCDLTVWDGKDCNGKVVQHLNGYTGLQTYNGQDYCIPAPFGVSFMFGPCS